MSYLTYKLSDSNGYNIDFATTTLKSTDIVNNQKYDIKNFELPPLDVIAQTRQRYGLQPNDATTYESKSYGKTSTGKEIFTKQNADGYGSQMTFTFEHAFIYGKDGVNNIYTYGYPDIEPKRYYLLIIAIDGKATSDVSKWYALCPCSVDFAKGLVTPLFSSYTSGTAYFHYVTDCFKDATTVQHFPGDNSGIGGGGGTFDKTNDAIDFSSLPTLSAVSAGFISLYAPTLVQLNALSDYMRSDLFDLSNFKKLFGNPMDAIIGLSIVPVGVPISGTKEVKIGFTSTGVQMNVANNQYVSVDCGSLEIAEYYGTALDYSPYTKFSIYLPYIGTRELSTDDIMRRTIHVVYNIDILSGSLTAMIKCGESVLYEFSGSCACSIPVTGQDFTRLVTAGIQLAGAGIAVAASGGSAAGLLPSTANAVLASKPNIQHTGAVSGAAGMLGVQQPYIIWELPEQSLAENYNSFVGYPSNLTLNLGSCSGYTQIENIKLSGISGTQQEKYEIIENLKAGVLF